MGKKHSDPPRYNVIKPVCNSKLLPWYCGHCQLEFKTKIDLDMHECECPKD